MLARNVENVLLFVLLIRGAVSVTGLLIRYLILFLPRRIKKVKKGLEWDLPFQRELSRITTEKSLWKARLGRELYLVYASPVAKQSKNFHRKGRKDVNIR